MSSSQSHEICSMHGKLLQVYLFLVLIIKPFHYKVIMHDPSALVTVTSKSQNLDFIFLQRGRWTILYWHSCCMCLIIWWRGFLTLHKLLSQSTIWYSQFFWWSWWIINDHIVLVNHVNIMSTNKSLVVRPIRAREFMFSILQ